MTIFKAVKMMANSGHIMTLANSIIGVGILAMPFCFQKCGIILSILLLIINNLVTRISCHYLIKSSVITRRKSFEFLAFHTFGSSGKLMVELCIIGYLLGTCIAYFVVVGDLGPQIIAKIFNLNENSMKLRSWVLVFVTISCIIPLGLLRNVDSLSIVCTASIGFYFCLVFKVISESSIQFVNNYWTKSIEYWKPSGILQCIPIFSMALACQIQIFEVLDTLPNPSIEKMNHVVNAATMICTYVYILVGFFGYVAFSNQLLSGNILVHLSTSLASDAIKMGFVLSVAFSFPLVVFPCRASIYSLLYRKGHADATGYIPEFRFKIITISIILFSLCVGLIIPSIELVIGLVGSTIGIAICVMFPALCFMKISKKESNERSLAQLILIGGFCLMILGTYANLNAIDEKHSGLTTDDDHHFIQYNKNNISENIKSKDKIVSPNAQVIRNKNVTKIEEKRTSKENIIVQKLPIPKPDNIINAESIQKANELEELKKTNHIVEAIKKQKNSEFLIENSDNNKFKKKGGGEEEKKVENQNNKKVVEIDKEAIKKEDEITAEEEAKSKKMKNVGAAVAANELEKTKELLEKKVDELKEQLAKQNVETQNLVVEKLGDIVQKVKQIEEQVYKDNQPLSLPQINTANISKTLSHNKSIDNKIHGNNQQKSVKSSDKQQPVKEIKEEIIKTISTVIKNNNNEQKKVQLNDNKNNDLNLRKLPRKNNAMEIRNLSKNSKKNDKKIQLPLPLPLLMNATISKQISNNSEIKISENIDKENENKIEQKIENNIKNDHENNIESIRRDILQVITSQDDIATLSSSNLINYQNNNNNKNNDKDSLREKRELSKGACINWDIIRYDCLDNMFLSPSSSNNNKEIINNSNLNTIIVKSSIQSIGRDLKSLRDKT